MMRLAVLLFSAVTVVLSPSVLAMEWHWLEQMRLAVQQTSYRGEFVHRRGDDLSAYSIVHRYQQDQSVELLRQLDGDMVEVFRQGERLVCYYPEGSSTSMNHPIPAAPFSQVFELDLDQIGDSYRAQLVGEEHVAGYLARIILLKGDEWRFSQKLWLEKDSDLLLQSEWLDSDGNALEQFRFTRLEIGADVAVDELTPMLEGQAERQQTIFRMVAQTPVDDQFLSRLEWVPEGFVLTHATVNQQAEKWTEQRSYSDGLSSFSVFVEKGTGMDSINGSVARMGVTNAFMATKSGYALTVVGEIPSKTAKKIVAEMLIQSPSL